MGRVELRRGDQVKVTGCRVARVSFVGQTGVVNWVHPWDTVLVELGETAPGMMGRGLTFSPDELTLEVGVRGVS